MSNILVGSINGNKNFIVENNEMKKMLSAFFQLEQHFLKEY